MIKPEVKEKIKKSIIWAIRKSGYSAFLNSRIRCPVRTGKLKSSAKDKILENGYSFEYSVPYASFPERGTRAGVREVRFYYRRDGRPVRAHSYYSRGQRAQKYIGKSMDEEFKSNKFADNLNATLSVNFKDVRRK